MFAEDNLENLKKDFEKITELKVVGVDEMENGYEFRTGDDREYIVFNNMDDATTEAVLEVSEMIVDDPQSFDMDWLSGFIYMLDEDKEDIAIEETDSYMEDVEDGDKLTSEEWNDKWDKKRDEIYDRLDGGSEIIEYFEEMGYELNEILDMDSVGIDTEEAAEDAIDVDGVAHFLATYDGKEIELNDGGVAYRRD